MITVVGLVDPSILLEDIGVTVPYRVAVNLSLDQAKSKSLAAAINTRKAFPLRGALPSGSVFRGMLVNPTGSAKVASSVPNPPPVVVRPEDDLTERNEQLQQEIIALRSQLADLQAKHKLLQESSSFIPSQLSEILESIKHLQASPVGSSVPTQTTKHTSLGLEDDIPLFLPSTKRDDVVASISVQEGETQSNLGTSKQALRSIRKKV